MGVKVYNYRADPKAESRLPCIPHCCEFSPLMCGWLAPTAITWVEEKYSLSLLLSWQFSTLGSLLTSVLGARFLDQKTGPQVTCQY